MHNLALAMHSLGHSVTGSDDIIYDPARSRLAAQGLLPDKEGWQADLITHDIDLIVLGMHAHADNPELLKAKKLGISIVSFPEFLGQHSANKIRVAICGSHGKTTTTAMVMHILKNAERAFDYAVGAGLEGFELMVGLSDAPLIVIEGDEYLSSALDRRAKFIHYKPQIAVLTGIAWDHVNVYPTFESYLDGFRSLLQSMEQGSRLIYNDQDENVLRLIEESGDHLTLIPYSSTEISMSKIGQLRLPGDHSLKVKFSGDHNVANITAAWHVCRQLDLPESQIISGVMDFELPDKRMNEVFSNESTSLYTDYAHSPSKVEAIVKSFNKMFERDQRRGVIELHTYSSLNSSFLSHYEGALAGLDEVVLFYNPRNLEIKRLPAIEDDQFRKAFDRQDLRIVTSSEELGNCLKTWLKTPCRILMMGSSNFGGLKLEAFKDQTALKDK